jgi:hypothetical protein
LNIECFRRYGTTCGTWRTPESCFLRFVVNFSSVGRDFLLKFSLHCQQTGIAVVLSLLLPSHGACQYFRLTTTENLQTLFDANHLLNVIRMEERIRDQNSQLEALVKGVRQEARQEQQQSSYQSPPGTVSPFPNPLAFVKSCGNDDADAKLISKVSCSSCTNLWRDCDKKRPVCSLCKAMRYKCVYEAGPAKYDSLQPFSPALEWLGLWPYPAASTQSTLPSAMKPSD